MHHFLTIAETSTARLQRMLERSLRYRTTPEPVLAGRTVCCLFEKPSLRTRVSFETAVRSLGGHVMSMTDAEVGVGARESPRDVARVLGEMVDGIVARVKSHHSLALMAEVSPVPVINGLSDLAHPAQALADVLTVVDEFSPGDPSGIAGRTVVFVGDGNNVARSLAVLCGKLGVGFRICSPAGYELPESWLDGVRAELPGARLDRFDDPGEAVRDADVIYCDTFISMGQEHERTERLNHFAAYQVNETLVGSAPAHAIVLHCLPASRGVEITDAVMDGAHSRVFQQARNRVDAQVGLLAELFG